MNRPNNNPLQKVLIIGSGPNRIGQGIEFDYCCVHSSYALKEQGITTIMYNCNPETVSTDYDTSDILYFEPIDLEHVRSVIDREKPDGIIVHFGGQTPLKLAKDIDKINGNIIGTSADVIDLAEDRERFSQFIEKYGLKQAPNGTAFSDDIALNIANDIGYPVLVRPSYVLGGRAMRIVYNDDELKTYMKEATTVSHNSPVLIDKFLDRATEIDVDAICDGKDVFIGGIMEHIEEAGIHSGDSACALPTISIAQDLIQQIKEQTKTIALNLGVKGLLNIQFAIYQNELYIIEVNPRASRTVPFISKSTSLPLAKVATLVMVDIPLREALKIYDKYNLIADDGDILSIKPLAHLSIKEAVFPFDKLGADSLLSPEMKSTGEVMGISNNFALSYQKAQIACKNKLPSKGNVFLSLADIDKTHIQEMASAFNEMGFSIYATTGTYEEITKHNIPAQRVLKVSEGRRAGVDNIVDLITNKAINLVINTTSSVDSKNDAFYIRQSVIKNQATYFSTISGGLSAIKAMREMTNSSPIDPQPIQHYFNA